MRVHFRLIQKRAPGRWLYSAWLIGFFAILLILGLGNLATGTQNPFYKWVFDSVYVSLGQTLYAITGFYIFSAAYRAFRARTLDAAILLIAGCFVILTNAPIGEVIWSGIPVIGRWMLDYGQVPAMRTFLITAAFGLLAFGFRALLGKERGFYGEVAE
jgi:cation transport ATPase